MTKIDLPHFLVIVLALILSSCATEDQFDTHKVESAYSSSTDREFEQIEKGDRQAPHYRVMNKVPVAKKKPQAASSPSSSSQSQIHEAAPTKKLSSKSQERLQEIQQNLAFFCMKHRNDPQFGDEEKCLKFTNKVLKSCEKNHRLVNTVMVKCVKDRLKKRR